MKKIYIDRDKYKVEDKGKNKDKERESVNHSFHKKEN